MVAEVDRVWTGAVVVKVVEVAVMFQPEPEPEASLTSNDCALVTLWSVPLRVAEKLTVLGEDTKASLPAVMVAVREVAPAGIAVAPRATAAIAAATPSFR